MMAARYSSAIFPRFSKETFIISNSSFNQPTPNKASARPFVSQSSVDHALACTMGLCRGRIDTEEDSFICFVWPPMYPRATVDRTSVVSGKSVSVRVDLGGRGINKKKKKILTKKIK